MQERPLLHPLEVNLTLANPYRDELKDKGQCIYFLRINETQVEHFTQALDSCKRLRLANFQQHISCGEIVGGRGAESLNATASWLSELFVPILGRYLTDRLQNRQINMWKCHTDLAMQTYLSPFRVLIASTLTLLIPPFLRPLLLCVRTTFAVNLLHGRDGASARMRIK